MKKYLLSACLFLMAAIPYGGNCAIIHIPGDYLTIQEGIDASADGDVVLVEPDTYYENLNLNGKNIILCSNYFTTGNTAFITNTIIDGSGDGRVITVEQSENSSCQVIGFTIQNGNSSSDPFSLYGGGIYISDASPQILHCIIQNNYAPNNGGGLSISGSSSGAKVINCTIRNNTADSFGGGVFMGDCSPDAEIINCTISGNTITCNCDFNGGGGGVSLYHTGKLENCLITGNSAPNAPVGGGGVYCDWGDYYGSQGIFITGCTIVNNTAMTWGGTGYVITGGEFMNCILWGNTDNYGNSSNYDGSSFYNCCTDPLPAGPGNISSDPEFVDTASGNFRLLDGSQCIDAGENAYSVQSVDLDGNPRVIDYVIDIGAYENGAGLNVQIGSGTDISSLFPIFSCYNYTYSQQIYLGSEITSGGGATGIITRIRFYYDGGGSQFSKWKNWTVYLGNTAKTEFTGISDWVPLSSLSQVFSGMIPDPVPGTWVEISLPVPYYYSGDNIVVAVDENSSGWDCTAQWGSYYSGTPRGLVFFDYYTNPDPASPPDASYDPDIFIAQVQFELNSNAGTLEGYITEEPLCTVPIAGATVVTGEYSTTSDSSGYYRFDLPVGVYANLTAIFHDALQTISSVEVTQGNVSTQDFCLQPYFAPPVGLQAQVYGASFDNVNLTWQAPGSVPDQWIHWDDGTMYGALGYNAPFVFSVASRWPVPDIAPYGGAYLKKIRFVVNEPTASYTLKVWKGANASTLLLSQVVDDPYINNWNDVTLTTPVLIDGTEELWFGYEVVQTVGYPAGLGPGPAVAGKGDMFNGGGGWFSMYEEWGWQFNWTLQGFVSESPLLAPQQVVPLVQNTLPSPIINSPVACSVNPQVIRLDKSITSKPSVNPPLTDLPVSKSKAIAPFAPSTTLTGYNIYRNDLFLANTADLTYDDLALPKGGYDYQVSAQYDYGESVRIGPVHVEIYTCFPPTGLTVSNATLTTTSAELSWTPSSISTNPAWTLEWGPAGFTQGWGTTVSVTTTPSYTLTNLTPGAEYDFYVRTFCSDTDASAWIKKTFRTHYFDNPAGATPEAEICGQNTNGCDLVPPAFENINCGDTIYGTCWLSRTHRDSDWYSFTLAETNDVTLTGNAEFSNIAGIGPSPCPSTFFYNSWYYGAGYSYPIAMQLGAGTYYVFVAPAYNEQVVCDSLSRYWVSLTCNSCLTPTSLNAINITSTSADLTWTSGANIWNIEWGPYGFTRGTGTLISDTGSNPYHLSGMTMGHLYSYYVQSDCGGGDTSNWAGPHSFYLPCPATTLPYSENFTAQVIGTTPQCWQVHGAGGPDSWQVASYNFAGGDFPELMLNPINIYGRSYFTSPVINTTGMASVSMSFKQYINAWSSTASFEVWTTSDSGNTWNAVWSYSQAGLTGPETKDLTISTPDVGSATFQFAFAVNGNAYDIGSWHIDDISLAESGPPVTRNVQNVTVMNGQSACFDATQTITVAGSGTTFIVEDGGIVTMIAGQNIDYLYGTTVFPGGYMLGKIAVGGPFCGAKSTSFVNTDAVTPENHPVREKLNLRIYPNPADEKFRMELAEKPQTATIRVEIYGMRGELVFSETLPGDKTHELSLAGKSSGIYFIKVVTGESIFTSKLVLTR